MKKFLILAAKLRQELDRRAAIHTLKNLIERSQESKLILAT